MKREDMYIGQPVENLGETAVVTGFHPVSGDPILRSLDNRYRWIADPGKCSPYESPRVCHRDGLVSIG